MVVIRVKHMLTGAALFCAAFISGAKATDATVGGSLDAPEVPSSFSVVSSFVRREAGFIGEHSQSGEQASAYPTLQDSAAPSLIGFDSAPAAPTAAPPVVLSPPAAPYVACQLGISECPQGMSHFAILVICMSVFTCLAATTAIMLHRYNEKMAETPESPIPKYWEDKEASPSSEVPENELPKYCMDCGTGFLMANWCPECGANRERQVAPTGLDMFIAVITCKCCRRKDPKWTEEDQALLQKDEPEVVRVGYKRQPKKVEEIPVPLEEAEASSAAEAPAEAEASEANLGRFASKAELRAAAEAAAGAGGRVGYKPKRQQKKAEESPVPLEEAEASGAAEVPAEAGSASLGPAAARAAAAAVPRVGYKGNKRQQKKTAESSVPLGVAAAEVESGAANAELSDDAP